MDEITKEFIIESTEALDCVDRVLVSLEKNPTDKSLLATVFRSIHTVKGTSGCLGYSQIERVAHAGENLLSRMRDGLLVLTAEITSALLAMTDVLRRMLISIEQTESEGEIEIESVVKRLQQLPGQAPEEKTAGNSANPPGSTFRRGATALPDGRDSG